ncbi:MAG: bifunctional hydroxymethylpyrimidine kinase/phosphomethylpyrimidine kinase [Deltaproteobacteria bacterium]
MQKTILTIAGSDPSGGAGAQADLKVFADHGLYGLSAITALTAQNSSEVVASVPVSSEFLKMQVEVLLDEFRPLAVKTGMTATASNIRAICRIIKAHSLRNVVVDTVMRSTLGFSLLDRQGLAELKRLVALSVIATPNIPEAAVLAGIEIRGIAGMEEAARFIHRLGPACVLVKGGHLAGTPVDVLFDGERFYHFSGRRLKGDKKRFHGTGCILSSAIASNLANGKSIAGSVDHARKYLHSVLIGRR